MNAADHITAATDQAIYEFDQHLARLHRNTPVVRVERESDKHWTVVDTANRDTHGDGIVVFRTQTVAAAARFACRFVLETPGARMDSPILRHPGRRLSDVWSREVLADVIPIRATPENGATGPGGLAA